MLFSKTSEGAEMLEQAAEEWALPCVRLSSWASEHAFPRGKA